MSFVGRQEGRQNISIGPKCEQKGVVMHEIFHALGRWHEHSRADRNEYVRVNLNNVLPGLFSCYYTVPMHSANNYSSVSSQLPKETLKVESSN